MKKTLSLLLATVFMLALLTPAFADFIRVEVTGYSFTIDSEGVFRFEAEEVDTTHHVKSTANPDNIMERADASNGKFLAAATGGVASDRYFEFSFTLDFNAQIEMSAAYAQLEKFKDRNEDMRNSYTYVIDGSRTLVLKNDPILAARTDITQWDIKTYEKFWLAAGTHTVKVSPLVDDGDGNPNIDYFEFAVTAMEEPPAPADDGVNRAVVTDYSFTIDSEGVIRLEAEEVDVTHHVRSTANPSDIMERDDASNGKFLAAATGGIASNRYFEFSFTLDFNAHIVMSAAYAQLEKFKDRNEDMRNSYTYVFDGELTARLTNDPILAARTDITQWDIKTYDKFALKAGTHTVRVSPKVDDGDGNPNIDYIEFYVIESDEEIEQNTISPANDIHTDLQYLYINDDITNIHNYATGTDASMSLPKAIVLNFSEDDIGTASEYIIQKSSTADFADATTVTGLTTKSYRLYNVYLGEHFYWRGGTSLDTIADSPVHEMTIASQGPRVLRVDGITNMRDIGGYDSYLVPGGKIRQGLYIRGANPDDITDLGKQQLYDLGIRQEIDMRDASHVVSSIPGVHYNNFPVSDGASEDARFDAYETSYKNIFELIANADLEPVYLHCYAGADRTGVASFILMAVCGASYEDCARDYLFTNFWKDGKRYISTVEKWVEKLNTQYEGHTLAEQARSWLMSKGVSSDTVERIREIFVEGYVPYENLVVLGAPVAQLSADGASVRLIGAVNRLNYKNAGFTVTVRDDINGKSSTVTIADRKVYTSIVTDSKTLTSEDFGIENGYLCVLIISNLPDEFSLTASTAVTVYANPDYVYSGTAKRFRYETGTLHAAGENNLAVNAIATDSGKEYYNENKSAQNAIDGNMSTDWQYATSAVLLTENSSTLTDCWLQVNFDEPVKVNTAIIKWETDTRCADGGYYLQYSLDGETFMDVPDSETVSGTTSTIYFTTVEAKYYRLVMTKGTSTKYAPKIYEFELHRD